MRDSRRSESDRMPPFKIELRSPLLRAEGMNPRAGLASTEVDGFSISSCIRVIQLTGK